MGKTALVTGASAGLGIEYAKLFAAAGHDPVLVARRADRLEQLAGELRASHGVRPRVMAYDLSEPAAPQRIFDELSREGVEVEYLVNNAGFGTSGAFAELDAKRELEMVQLNVTALVHLTRLFVPGMIARKSGRVLNVGSTAGFQPGPFMAVYYASKAFVNSFTEALAYELRGTGVTATVSCPGATATEFASLAGNDRSKLFKGGAADAASVAREGFDAMMAGRPMVVHGWRNKTAVQALRLSPRSTVLAIAASLNKD